MGYAVTTFFLGCILLLSVRIGALNIGPDAGAGAGGGVTSGGAQTSPDTGAGAGGGATAVAGAAAGGQVTVDGAATGAGAAGAGAAPSAGTAASSAGGGAVSPSTSSGAGLPSASSDATPGTNISTLSAGAGIVGASGTGAGVGTAASSAGSGAAAPSASSGVTPGAGTATLSVGAGAGVDDAGAAAGAGAGDVGAGAGGTVAGANASVVAGAGAGNAGAAAGDGVGAGGGAAGIVDAGAGATGGGGAGMVDAGAGAATGAGGVGAAAGAGGPGAATDAGGAGFGTAGGASAPAGAGAPAAAPAGAGAPIVPCYFIFGDSLADCGNNNELKTLTKANFLPYGVDYPSGPTGRFTNGRTYVDFIAEYLGFPNHIPPYAAVRGSERVLQGVNYASAGAGIRPETGKILGERVNLDSQLDHHTLTIARIKELKGNNDAATQQYLGKCLYTVGIGSNDYMSNYLLAPANPNDVVFTPDTWAAELGRRIDAFLRKLHSLGARKVALYGLGPIGCEPAQVKLLRNAGKQGCAENVNQMISLYNGKLAPIVDGVNKLPDAKFIFVNISHISPAGTGIKVYDEPCCPTEAVAGSCVRNSTPCPNRGEYAFFDSFHPTEKTVLPAATRAWKALEPQDTYPMDISRLVKL